MQLDFHWVNILILFGGIQGMVFACILIFNKRHPGRVYLALVTAALVYNAFETLNWSAGLDHYIIFFDLFPFVTIFLIGPGFYLYYKALLIPDFVAKRKEILLLFAPFIFQLGYAAVKAIGYLAYFRLGWKSLEVPLTYLFRIFDIYSEIWSLLVFLFFTVLSVIFVKGKFRGNNADLRQRETVNWVRSLLIFQIVFAIGWTLTLMAPIWYTGDGSHYYPIELFLVLFLYWSAMAGFWKVKSIHRVDLPERKETNPEAFDTLEVVRLAMENDKLFLNPILNLQAVADHLKIPPKSISYALNQAGNINFNDFVNSFRIAEFCERMATDKKTNLTIFGVAQECGFQSPATFQRAFKKVKNVTPKAFLSGSKSVQMEI